MNRLLKIFTPVVFDGECKFEHRERGEELLYTDEHHRLVMDITHCRGRCVYPDSANWESGRPSASEQRRVFGNIIKHLAGRQRWRLRVSLNVDDPRINSWRKVCEDHRELVREIDMWSDDKQIEFVKEMTLDIVRSGGKAQLGDTSAPTQSIEDIEAQYRRRRAEQLERRTSERQDLENGH